MSVDLFDRLGNLLKSILDEEEQSTSADPDFASAWDELNQYMSDGEAGTKGGFGNGFDTRYGRTTTQTRSVPEELRQDYRNLEVEFGAPMDLVRKSYRALMVTYHPDRFANNPRKLQIATEITKKLGESYRRIKQYHEGKRT